jgi:hypothetical protein
VDFVERQYGEGDDDELEVLVAAWCSAFAESTAASYVGRVRDFAKFCVEHEPPLPGLPASKQHVHLYLAHLAMNVLQRQLGVRAMAN